MNVPAPPKKAPGAGELTGRKLIASRQYHALDVLQARTVWESEAARLFREFWRTGNQKHLRAFFTHVVAMRAYKARATQ